MKVTVLQISANLENVTNLSIGSDFNFPMKFKCTTCDTETEKTMLFPLERTIAIMGGKNHVNLIFKCKNCLRQNTVAVIDGSLRPYTIDDSSTFKTLIELDCRGCTPTTFEPMTGFTCVGVDSQKEFSDVDLSELNWADYDENVQESVGIYDLKYQFDSLKK